MNIKIGYDFNNDNFITNKDYEHNPEEDKMLLDLTVMLGGKDFKIYKPAEDYTTLQYKNRDICRLKYTSKSHWIRILIPSKIKKKYIDSTLFYSQDNKNQVFWVSHFGITLDDYVPIIKDVMNFIDEDIKKES